MAIDTSIYNALMQQPRSAVEYADQFARRDFEREQRDQQRQQNALAMRTAQQSWEDDQAVRTALSGAAPGPQGAIDALQSARNPAALARAQALQKAQIDAEHVRAQTGQAQASAGKSTADTAKTEFETRLARHQQAVLDISSLRSADDALASLTRHVQAGDISMQQAAPMLQQIQALQQSGDQGAFAQWRGQMVAGLMSARDRAEQEWRAAQDATTRRGQDLTAQTAVRGQDVTAGTARRGQDMTDARTRETNDINRQGQRVQVVQDPERGMILVDKGTGLARPAVGLDGRAVQGGADQKRQSGAQRLLPVLDDAESLVKDATGSYIGTGVDLLAQGVGMSTGGAQATARLKVLEGQIMMNAPRMEGPQSDRDVQMYRQMAGAIGDPTVPRAQKLAALAEIRRINERYAAGGRQQMAPAAQAPGGGVIDFGSLK